MGTGRGSVSFCRRLTPVCVSILEKLENLQKSLYLIFKSRRNFHSFAGMNYAWRGRGEIWVIQEPGDCLGSFRTQLRTHSVLNPCEEVQGRENQGRSREGEERRGGGNTSSAVLGYLSHKPATNTPNSGSSRRSRAFEFSTNKSRIVSLYTSRYCMDICNVSNM